MPSKVRSRDVLPDPFGPIMPRTWPAVSWKVILARIADFAPGAATISPSASRLETGFGKGVSALSRGSWASVADNR
jgi:hypothetical protein